MNWMSRKDKQINFKRKFSELNKIDNFKNLAQKENIQPIRENNILKGRDFQTVQLDNKKEICKLFF